MESFSLIPVQLNIRHLDNSIIIIIEINKPVEIFFLKMVSPQLHANDKVVSRNRASSFLKINQLINNDNNNNSSYIFEKHCA